MIKIQWKKPRNKNTQIYENLKLNKMFKLQVTV